MALPMRRHALARIALACASLVAAAGTAAATPPTPSLPSVPKAVAARVRAVIQAQLAAFAADDADRAFSYAAPSIRSMFGNSGRFIDMVRARYPVVYRPTSVDFLEPVRQQRDVLQAVLMSDSGGAVWVALYTVQRQRDGAWRIGGCELRRQAGQAT